MSEKKINEICAALNEAFKMISAIPVSGENVEIMAAAKECLRRAYALTEKKDEEKTDG